MFDAVFELLYFLEVVSIGLHTFSLLTLLVKQFIAFMDDALHSFPADRTSALQNGLIIKRQHLVHIVAPEIQAQVLSLLDPQLGLFQEDHY